MRAASSLAILLAALWVFTPPAAADVPGPVVGKPAPRFALTTLDGRHVTLASYRGKTLVINVWGSWCPPCRLETADLNAESAAMRRASVVFLGVDSTETAEVVRAYVAAKGIPYPQAVVASRSAFVTAYGIENFPTTFVVDPNGLLRARHADNILPRAQLHSYIVAAQHGTSAPLESEEQRQLDALLAPGKYPFGGDRATIVASVRAAADAIAKADDMMDESMSDPARDHDLIRTHDEQNTLRAAAIAALAPVAESDAERALLARLRGDQAAALERWSEADAAYAEALKLDPKDTAALGGAAYAASELGDDARAATLDARLAGVDPSYDSFIGLTLVLAKLGQHDSEYAKAAYIALDRAVALAQHDIDAKPNDRSLYAELAWTHLYGGRAAVKLGDATRARLEFERADAAARRLPHDNPRYAMYVEEAQEATVALDLHGSNTALSLAPWTGADLPGSIASTYKYRLAVSGAPGARIRLRATGLPKGWIGSFCSDRVCAPFMTTVTIPAGRVKIVEFQIVPAGGRGAHPTVSIDALNAARNVATVAIRL